MVRKHPNSKLAEAVKKEINGQFHDSLKVQEWDHLVEEGYLDEIERNPSIRDRVIIEMIQKIRENRSQKSNDKIHPMLSQQEAEHPTQRSEIISILIAQEATEDTAVCLFRTEVLGDILLPFEKVETWIQHQAKKDGPSTILWSNIPLPQTKVDELRKFIQETPPEIPYFSLEIPVDQLTKILNFQRPFLYYGIPTDNWMRSLPISIEGTLKQLQQLSEHLEKRYGWQQAQATIFVLTGITPLIRTISATLKRRPRPLFQRIVLEIDPVVLPQEVAKQYKILRKEITPTRPRKLTEKHMQLAIFISKRSKSEAWAKKMNEWNKECQIEWKYKEVSNFALDCRQARKRLLSS